VYKSANYVDLTMILAEGLSSATAIPNKPPRRVATDTAITGGRSRRRRHITKNTDSTDVASLAGEKENYHRSAIKRKDEYDLLGSASITITSPNTAEDKSKIYKTCGKDFRRSLKYISVSSILWKNFPYLKEILVHTSLSSSRSDNNDFVSLDGHTSALLTLSRKLIKDVTETDKTKTTANSVTHTTTKHQRKDISIEDNLFVAVHILRSIAFVFAGTATVEKKESLLKLFYHLITTATQGVNNNKEDSSSSTISPRLRLIALAGYEGLATVLSHYLMKQKFGEKKRVVSFQLVRCTSADDRFIFAIPSANNSDSKLTESSTLLYGNMSVRQVSTIALKATMQVAKIMLNFHHKSEISSIENNFQKIIQYPSSYGSIASIISDDGNRLRLHQVASEILHLVHRPWVVFLASASITEREIAKEVISYSKNVHRLLWDAASALQSSFLRISSADSGKEMVKSVVRDCLELRKCAIIHLLPRFDIYKMDFLILKTSFESACTCAWKAAAVYAQHLSPTSSKLVPSNPDVLHKSLFNFYSDLDSVFERLHAMDPVVPIGFVEYIGYKYLHGGPKVNTLLVGSDVNGRTMEKDEISNGNYRVLLNILELAISSKIRIEELTCSSRSNMKEQCEKEKPEWTEFDDTKISSMDSLVKVFNRQMTNGLDKIATDIQSRILKVFCNLSLQKVLYTSMKHDLSIPIITIETELLIGANFLSKCLGPFVLTLIDRCPQKSSQLVDLMMECFLRPLSLYEHLSVVHRGKGHDRIFQRYSNLSNIACKTITEILIDCSRPKDLILPIKCLEKVAKQIYFIARQRTEKSMTEESLLPLLYSLKLYGNLDLKNNENKDYQLSSRLFLLSSTFQVLDKINESFLISCLIIEHESRNYHSNASGTRDADILNFLGEKSYGLLPPTTDGVSILPQVIKSLCRQMATNLTKVDKSKTRGPEEVYTGNLSIPLVIKSLMADFPDNKTTIQAAHPLDSIGLLLDFDRLSDNGEILMSVFSATEILRNLGQLVQKLSCDSNSDESQLKNALNNYSFLHKLLQKSLDGLSLEYPSVAKGLLGLIAAAGIVPCTIIAKSSSSYKWKNGVNTLLIDTAIRKTSASLCNLEKDECDEQTSWSLQSESLRIILRLFLVVLQRNTIETSHYDNLLSDCVSVAKMIVNSGEKDDVLLRAKYWAIWSVVNLQNQLESSGDHDRAAVLSLWVLALAEKIEPYQPWFHASMVTACIEEGNLLRLNNSMITTSLNKCLLVGSAIWIFEKEFQLCQIRIATLQCGIDDQKLYHIEMQKVEDIRVELKSCVPEEGSKLFAIYTWVLSTVYLVKSDIALAFGCYPTALKTAQICQKCCQVIMKRASYNLVNYDSWILAVATSTVFSKASQRYIHILSLRPKLHYRMGNHRKALAYMRSILTYLNIDPILLTSAGGCGIVLKDLTTSLKTAPQVRLFLEMKSWASTPDMTMQEFSNISPSDLKYHHLHDTNQSNSTIVDSIQDLIAVGDIMYGDSVPIGFLQTFNTFYTEAVMLMTKSANIIQEYSLMIPIRVEENLGMPVVEQVKLRDVRMLLDSSNELNKDSVTTIRNLCAQIEESKFSSSEDKAWSLYYLGLLELDNARCSGALQIMWTEHKCDDNLSCSVCNEKSIRTARNYFLRSSLYAAKASDIFTRNILRSLALAEGPNINHGVRASAGMLILKSIGQSIRRRLAWTFSQVRDSIEGRMRTNLKDIFSIFDGPCTSDHERDDIIELFLRELAVLTPKNWQFCAPVICPSGEILITIMKKEPLYPDEFTISTTCIFPSTGESAYDDIMKPLDSILIRVQEQLHGINQSDVSKSDDKESIKRQWWDERSQLDNELCDLLENVEAHYFSNIFDSSSTENLSDISTSNEELDEFPCGNLASRFEAVINASNDDDSDDVDDSESEYEKKRKVMQKLTVLKLKNRLLEAGANNSKFRRLRKSELIDLLIQIEQDNGYSESDEDTDEPIDRESDTPDNCLFLILDENLHRFPFEGMPILKGKTVCRVPCISFVLATLRESKFNSESFPVIDPSNVSYIVDPENNLQATQKRLLPAIESLSSSQNWNWDGVVGKIPPTSFYSEGLSKKNGLTMYFGHGGAQVCFSRRQVEELIDSRVSDLIDQSDMQSSCNASVLLMGCSSGRLVSINRKNSDSLEETPLYYEPEGVALSYLCAGAPCVVGNLWDVTDNDIDRFSVSLLKQFFDEKYSGSEDIHHKHNISLAMGVSTSRSACKLKYLVGCAPVCYGVPVFLKSMTTHIKPTVEVNKVK